ncbi:MAG: glycoside hydrolase [Spirochaetes bacterium]|nr:glycoside hydrolase [Spirochaetota bacterium]
MKKKHCIIVFIIVVILFLLTSNLQSYVPDLSKRIIGYYISWGMYDGHKNYLPKHIPWTKITHINYAFAEIKQGTWEIRSIDPWADHDVGGNGQIGQINDMKNHYGVKTLISIGGWTRSGKFSALSKTDASRTAFATDCVRFIRQYKFDGVDIDWEYPCYVRAPDPNLPGDEGCPGKPEDKSNFTLLLKKLRETLDKAGKEDEKYYYLTIAAPGAYDKIKGPSAMQEPDKYHKYLDWINIMSYDFHGGWDKLTAHHTALYFNSNDPYSTSPINIKEKYNGNAIIKYYKDKYGVPALKMNIGAAYYARSWKDVEDNNTGGLFQNGKPRPKHEGGWEYGCEGFYTIKQWETNSSYKYSYDNIAKAPYLYSQTNKLFFTYDDEISIADKCDYVINNHYGGIIFWELTGDYPATGGDLLTSVIYNKFSNIENKGQLNNKTDKLNLNISKENNQLTFISKAILPIKVSIYNVNFQEIYSFILSKKENTWQKEFASGVYFYKVGNSKHKSKFKIE